MKKRTRISFSSTHLILISFLLAILLGALLLMLPISTKARVATPFVDALFTATTATCVTGLVVAPTFSTWSVFGQIIILLLIQIGGLGVLTVLASLSIFMHKKMGLSDRLLLQDAFNLNSVSGIVSFVKKVVLGTLIIEGVGALLYMLVFIPEFGWRGIWVSIFNAVSAFCNAGIDIIAENSLSNYISSPLVNTVTCLLITLGGLGFIVWWDIARVFKSFRQKHGHPWRRLTLHSKIVLFTSFFLIVAGALAFFFLERNNPLTFGPLSTAEQIGASVFQSVTTRTAGFFTVPQEHLTNASALVSLLLMFIGGSPVGTAGGIKTVTFAILFSSAASSIRGRNDVNLFGRRISPIAIRKAIGVTFMSFLIVFASSIALATVTDAPLVDLLYETVSATATVGLSRNLTPTLNTAGRYIIAATMYLGRVGPISLAFAFNVKQDSPNLIKNPTEEVSVG